MSKFYFLFLLNFVLTASAQKSTSLAQLLGANDYVPNTVILKVKPEYRGQCSEQGIEHANYKLAATQLQVDAIVKKFKKQQAPEKAVNAHGQSLADLSLIYEIHYIGNYPLEKAIRALLSTGVFIYAEPHLIPQLAYTPNDPLATPGNQYHLQTINAFNAWTLNRGDSSIVIGITDTGTDPTHNDLFTNIKRNLADPIDGSDNDGDGYIDNYMGWDVGMNDNDPTYQANPHGVHVCGIAGAQADNNIGGAGVGFNCKIMPVKISDAGGSLIAAYEGIKYAADHGCQIINCSWGSNGFTQFGQDMVTYATINKNALVVAAAGNNGNSLDFYPAACNYAFAVANTNSSDVKAGGSDYGYFVDVCAPGESIQSTWPGNFYLSQSGTSMSSPCVAGAAGIVKNQFPSFNGLQVGERLRVTADNIYPQNPSYINQLGTGRINLYRALSDPMGPSVIFSDRVASDHKGDVFLSGDTLFITGKFTNYLGATAALNATLSTTSAYAVAVDNTTALGVIPTLGFKDNNTDPFRFKLTGSIPLNQTVDFKLELQDGSYQATTFFTVYINLDYINIAINDVHTTATSKGKIGYNMDGQSQGLGFNYKGTDMVYDVGLMIGNDTNRVSDCIRGANPSITDVDFATVSRIQRVIPSVISDFDTQATISDNVAFNPLPVTVLQKNLAWSAAPNEKFVIWEYTITNTHGSDTLKTLYAGICADWDIDGSSFNQNRSGYDALNKMGYSFYTGSNGRYAGIKLLTSNAAPNFYAMDNVTGGSGGLDATNGFTTKEKYLSLSTQRLNAGVGGTGNDIMNVMATGPIVLKPSQSIKVAFALLGGDSLTDLKNSAAQAQIKYNGLPTTVVANNDPAESFQMYPNPAGDHVFIRTGSSETWQGRLLDVSGALVQTIEVTAGGSQLDISGLSQGVYFLQLESRRQVLTQKLIKLK